MGYNETKENPMEIHTGLPNHTCGGMGVWLTRILAEDGFEAPAELTAADKEIANCESCHREQLEAPKTAYGHLYNMLREGN